MVSLKSAETIIIFLSSVCAVMTSHLSVKTVALSYEPVTAILNQYKSPSSPLVFDPVKAHSVPVSSGLLGAIVSSLSALCLAFPCLRYT